MMNCRYILLWNVSWKESLGKSKQFRCGIRNRTSQTFHWIRQ